MLNSCLYKDTEFYVADGQLRYRPDCANAALGFVNVGYRVPKSGLIFQYDHTSSITDHDPGLDTISIPTAGYPKIPHAGVAGALCKEKEKPAIRFQMRV